MCASLLDELFETSIATIGEPDAIAETEDLLKFIEEDLNSPLWEAQRAIVKAIDEHPRVAVRSAHSVGKSHVSSRIAVAYLQTHTDSIVITTAPTGRQVTNVLWRYIRGVAASAIRPLKGKRGHPLQTVWEISPNWYALGFKASNTNTDAFQGFHSSDILVIVDEAAGVTEPIYEAMEAILTGSGARLLLIGNPTSINGTFRSAFHEQREFWHTLAISADATPNFTTFGITRKDVEEGTWQGKVTGPMPYPALIDPAWAARQIAIHGKDSPYVLSRVWSIFPRGGEFTLIPLSDIEAGEDADDIAETDDGYELGVDVARYGSDETALCLRKGEEVIAQDAWRGFAVTSSAGRIKHFLDKHHAKNALIKVDEIGLGGGLLDILIAEDYNAVGINVSTASSDNEKWANLRHELWWNLAERFRERRIKTRTAFDEVSKGQLSDIHYRWQPNRSMPVIETKDEAKKRGAKSPDRAEAMMLAFAPARYGQPVIVQPTVTRTHVKRRG